MNFFLKKYRFRSNRSTTGKDRKNYVPEFFQILVHRSSRNRFGPGPCTPLTVVNSGNDNGNDNEVVVSFVKEVLHQFPR